MAWATTLCSLTAEIQASQHYLLTRLSKCATAISASVAMESFLCCHRMTTVPSTAAKSQMRIYNSDGSEPETCGNGIRCMARFVADVDGNDDLGTIQTLAGAIVLRRAQHGHSRLGFAWRECLGTAMVRRKKFPSRIFQVNQEVHTMDYRHFFPRPRGRGRKLRHYWEERKGVWRSERYDIYRLCKRVFEHSYTKALQHHPKQFQRHHFAH